MDSKSKNRACLNCAIILPQEQFKRNGCPNCPFLQTEKRRNYEVTTSNVFKGQIYYIDPSKSWIGKWQRNKNYIPGFYAMVVEGDLPDEFIGYIEKTGSEYICRQQSFTL